jgi:hypothetical protein
MGLRERAAVDARKIMETVNGAGTPFVLIDLKKQEYHIMGIYGDIGYLLDQATGEAVQGRTIEAAYSMASLKAQTPGEPGEGWHCKVIDLSGTEIRLSVKMYTPDKTIGIARLKLAVN